MNETGELLTELDEPMDEVQELTWALVDEMATEKDIARLEELLLGDEEARRTYVMCMQMHCDLHYLLGGRRPTLPDVLELARRAEQLDKAEQAEKAARKKQSNGVPTNGTSVPISSLPSPGVVPPMAGELA